MHQVSYPVFMMVTLVIMLLSQANEASQEILSFGLTPMLGFPSFGPVIFISHCVMCIKSLSPDAEHKE